MMHHARRQRFSERTTERWIHHTVGAFLQKKLGIKLKLTWNLEFGGTNPNSVPPLCTMHLKRAENPLKPCSPHPSSPRHSRMASSSSTSSNAAGGDGDMLRAGTSEEGESERMSMSERVRREGVAEIALTMGPLIGPSTVCWDRRRAVNSR